MNLLYVIHYPIFGGPHNEALRLHEAQQRRGWHTTVLLPDEPGNAAQRLQDGGVAVVQAPLHRFRATPKPAAHLAFSTGFAPEVARIRRLIRERHIDLVMVGGLVNPHAAIAARLEGTPVVWEIVDSRAPAPFRAVAMPIVRKLADAALFDGRALVDLHTAGRPLPCPWFVYYPPVDTSRFLPSSEQRAETRRALNIPNGAPVIGMVANLNRQKGIEYFVRAASLIYRTLPECWFLVVGARYDAHPDYLAQIDAEVAASGVPPERFVFTGERADVERFYPAMDMKLITSVPRSEGTTTTAMEAGACGIPVVATDVGAVREVVENGVTGFVVPPLDPAAIARATLRLLQDPDLRRRMGEEGRRHAVERYDVEVCADTHVRAFRAAIEHHRARRSGRSPSPIPMPERATVDTDLRRLLVCPACHGPLEWVSVEVRCPACPRAYPIEDGIPILLLDHAAAEHDELEHLHGHAHAHDHGNGHSSRERQMAYFDHHAAAEFETTRPHGAPHLYRFLMREKFRRSLAGLNGTLAGATALTVCGGSGMDGEFLARAGAQVIVSDLSLGAAQRAQERARRYGLPILAIVADVERLPFADRAVDLVYVHDGLHHIEQPHTGLAEMARVANRAVSITEPAQAIATQLAVRAGWATNVEEAGNRVARLTIQETVEALRDHGLRVTHSERYAMHYRHQPGAITQRLSHPVLYPLARASWLAGNGLIGRIGNKLTVQAVRPTR